MRHIFILILALSTMICSAADAPEVRLSVTEMRGCLDYYERLTKSKVWISTDVDLKEEVAIDGEGSRVEMLKLIRTVLLEKYGIQVRDGEGGQTFVSLSEDPKHMELRKSLGRSYRVKKGQLSAPKYDK